MKIIFSISSFIFLGLGCATSTSTRQLSPDEMDRFQLNGVIHDARICPNQFNEKANALQVVGPCEIVNCDQVDGEITCQAAPDQSR